MKLIKNKWFVGMMSFLMLSNSFNAIGQACSCTEYIYVNDTERDEVHKFMVDPTTGVLTEIGNPWLDDINDPHGGVFSTDGAIYIGEKNLGAPIESRLIKLACDGTRLDTLFSANFNDNDVVNFVSQNWVLYSAGRSLDLVTAYDLCSETEIGTIDVASADYNWELFDGADGMMYTIDRDIDNLVIFQVPYDTNLYDGTQTITPFLTTNLTKNSTDEYWGVDRDEFGYWYVNVREFTNGNLSANTIYMLSPTGMVLTSIVDNIDSGITGTGFFNARGIVYSEDGQKLYVTSTNEACVSVINVDRTVGSESLTEVPGLSVPGGGGKDIVLAIECCPLVNDQIVNKNVCIAESTGNFLINENLDCKGIICEGTAGTWQLQSSDPPFTFDFCTQNLTFDNSIDNSLGGCALFTKNSDGTGANAQCGAFNITLNFCVYVQPETPIISIIDNTCEPAAAGSLNIDTPCQTGNTIEYSTDAGASWSATAPTYNSITSISVRARCANDIESTCVSAETADFSSAPKECCPVTNCIRQFGEFTIQKRIP